MIQIKPLIQHLVLQHLDTIVGQSLLHCHVKGLHSIMLLNHPEHTIRLYYADEEHELWKNYPGSYGDGNMSLGFHSHHCNLTLHVIRGSLINWVVDYAPKGFMASSYLWSTPIPKGFMASSYLWSTPITGGAGTFQPYELGVTLDTVQVRLLDEKDPVAHMEAQEIHTVCVEKGQPAAWLVYEGREDPGYVPITMSNQDLTKISMEGLYVKPSMEAVVLMLSEVGLL